MVYKHQVFTLCLMILWYSRGPDVHFATSVASSEMDELFATESSDFSKVVTSSFFVDKTLLIEELFSDSIKKPRVSTVRPGPHFSKSTNINMLKRYFEIVVNNKAAPIDIKTTDNYKLFTENNLSITQNKDMLNVHFGKYPVVNINYKPLELVKNYKHLLTKYKVVVYETFNEHKYLLNVNELWSSEFNITDFRKYLNLTKELNKTEILNSFTFLSKLLHQHFRQRVIVLVDDYDIIMDSPLSEKYRDKVFELILNVKKELIKNTKDVYKVYLSGCHRRQAIPGDEDTNVLDRDLWKYYGLSHDELISLLQRFSQDNREVEVAANTIVDLYSGYVRDFESYDIGSGLNSRTISVCSVWSVMQYFICMKKSNITMI